ncbi:uncharacterized protein B0T15DRAFT_287861 [Chaetomium strumarium]|uniref:Vacuolar ATPase assembly protein VMA22 n=1 Tax=Chaetomium strumarium TaxID=1170767 RepID=A0AAJ0LY72_9PEZI|nr:hypothetical protein B0T15DRAFT_287861 [Chaetomium strumarium]
MSNQASAATETIDLLLEHYLALLDEYTTLRGTLNTVQADIFHSLARANFSAERGIRYYGQDYYDERMQAIRRIQIGPKDGKAEAEAEGKGDTDPGANRPVFTVRTYPPSASGSEPDTVSRTSDGSGSGTESKEAEKSVPDADAKSGGVNPSATDDSSGSVDEKQKKEQGQEKGEEPGPTSEEEQKPRPKDKPTDPLRWFGILTPLALRQAQGHAIKAVEEIIPRLATLNVEMAAIEVEVRRARKRRAKAEKAEEKRVAELADQMGHVDVSA